MNTIKKERIDALNSMQEAKKLLEDKNRKAFHDKRYKQKTKIMKTNMAVLQQKKMAT